MPDYHDKQHLLGDMLRIILYLQIKNIKEFIAVVILSMEQAFNDAQVFQAIQDQLNR